MRADDQEGPASHQWKPALYERTSYGTWSSAARGWSGRRASIRTPACRSPGSARGTIRDLVWRERYGDGFDSSSVRDADAVFLDPVDLSRNNDDWVIRLLVAT